MRFKPVALAFCLGLGQLYACTGDNEQSEAVQGEVAADNASDEITPESQEVADAELITTGEAESPTSEDNQPRSSEDSDFAETDESMAMYSEPPLPSDEPEVSASEKSSDSKLDEPATPPAIAEDTSNATESVDDVVKESGQAAINEPISSPADSIASTSSPGAGTSPSVGLKTTESAPQETKIVDKIGTYTVRPGDTLGKIAVKLYHRFNRYKDLAEENGLSHPYLLYPGQTLRYGGSVSVESDSAPNKTLVVQSGDTLWHLAQKYLGSPYAWQAFVNWNHGVLTDPNKIAPGMKLVYGTAPQAQATASAPNPSKTSNAEASGAQIDTPESTPTKRKTEETSRNEQKSAKLNHASPTTKVGNPVKSSTMNEVNEAKKAAFDQLAEPPEVPENSFEEEEAE